MSIVNITCCCEYKNTWYWNILFQTIQITNKKLKQVSFNKHIIKKMHANYKI